MAELLQSLPSVIFPMEADELTIDVNGEQPNADGSHTIDLILHDPSYAENTELISSDFFANEDNEIELDDLGGYINDYMEGDPMLLELFVNHVKVASSIVIPSRVSIELTAEEYCKRYFLDMNNKILSNKTTYADAHERLSVYLPAGAEKSRPSIHFAYTDGVKEHNKTVVLDELSLSPSLTYGKIVTFDVSPALFNKYVPIGCRLLFYKVKLGKRVQNYTLYSDMSIAEPLTLVYTNNFGQIDTYHFFGAMAKEFKPSYSALRTKGKKQNYYVEAMPTWTVYNRDWLEPGLFEDLAVSQKVWRQEDMTEIVITECDMKDGGSQTESVTVSLSFQESTRQYKWRPRREVRTFDETFDATFF